MSDAHKAVFLSYASQDTEAAKRICEALRAAGVEVWFDQSELVGGDAWDQKIRRHIKECTLLIPIISAATQARTEGYFRLEWRLADQRTHLMAKGRPFLLPVVIDDTRDADAHVPDSFTEVQWTRLRQGFGGQALDDASGAAFAERVKKLLGGEVETGRPRPAERGSAFAKTTSDKEGAASPRSSRPAWLRYAWAAVGITLAIFYGLRPLWQPVRHEAALAGKTAAVANPANDLVVKARALIDDDPLVVRENYRTAVELCERAVALAPDSGEAWATLARANFELFWDYNERSDRALAALRSQVERAARLAPQSIEAKLAQANFELMNEHATSTAGVAGYRQKLLKLHEQAPEDRRILGLLITYQEDDRRILGTLATTQDGKVRSAPTEAIRWAEQANARPGGDADALARLAWVYWSTNQFPELSAVLERSLALQPTSSGYHLKLMLLYACGDLAGAQAWLQQIPPSILQEDRVAAIACQVYIALHQPEKVLEVLARNPRDFLEEGRYFTSRGSLTGDALRMTGKPRAAEVEYRGALKAVEERIALNPRDSRLIYWKAILLVRLGNREEALRQLETAREMGRFPMLDADVAAALGRNDEVIATMDKLIAPAQSRWPSALRNLKCNPVFESLRGDPRVQAIIARGDRLLAELLAGGDAKIPSPSSLLPAPLTPPEADAKSVAVLAFANLSDDKGNEYFSDGISEELLTVLQKIPGLHVAARTSSFYFKGKEATAQEIGTKLGVANLVEGSVQKSGTRVKVIARLSRVSTGEELWSQSYTRELKEVFALQEELTLAIVGELRGQLAGGVNAAAVKAAVKGGTTNAEAYQQFLQGRYYANRHAEKSTNEAIAYFQRAVELDPGFALAWSGLARAHVWLCEFSSVLERTGFDEHLALARTALVRALALEPSLPDGLLARAEIQLNFDFDWKGAAETLHSARVLAPADPVGATQAGNLALAHGDLSQAIGLYRQAVALDPVNPQARSFLAFNLAMAGRYAESQAEYPRVIELNPSAPWAYAGLGMSYLLVGKFDLAATTAQEDGAEWARLLVTALARFGQKRLPEADAALAQLRAKFSDTAAYQVAEVYAYRGDLDHAFEWLDRARHQRDAGIVGLQRDQLLDKLKADQRWDAFLRTLGLAPDQLK